MCAMRETKGIDSGPAGQGEFKKKEKEKGNGEVGGLGYRLAERESLDQAGSTVTRRTAHPAPGNLISINFSHIIIFHTNPT